MFRDRNRRARDGRGSLNGPSASSENFIPPTRTFKGVTKKSEAAAATTTAAAKQTQTKIRPAWQTPLFGASRLRLWYDARESFTLQMTDTHQVVMKIIKHSSQLFPTTATGSIVGMEVSGILQVTNCFPFPTLDNSSSPDHDQGSNIAAAAPRAKANAAYQNEMIKFLREVNVDANNVGWYTSTSMGNFVNLNTIENQFFYQKEMNERTIALVHDVSRSSQGALSLKAFRLSPSFMAAYKEAKFTTERYAR